MASILGSATLPSDIIGQLEGNGLLNRTGFFIDSTAGYIDPELWDILIRER